VNVRFFSIAMFPQIVVALSSSVTGIAVAQTSPPPGTAVISNPSAGSTSVCQNDTFQVIFTVDGSTGYKPDSVEVDDQNGSQIGLATGTDITQQTKADGSTYFIANVTVNVAGKHPKCQINVITYKLVQATPPPNVTYKPVYATSGVQNVTIIN